MADRSTGIQSSDDIDKFDLPFIKHGRKVQISIGIDPDQYNDIVRVSKELGQGRVKTLRDLIEWGLESFDGRPLTF